MILPALHLNSEQAYNLGTALLRIDPFAIWFAGTGVGFCGRVLVLNVVPGILSISVLPNLNMSVEFLLDSFINNLFHIMLRLSVLALLRFDI